MPAICLGLNVLKEALYYAHIKWVMFWYRDVCLSSLPAVEMIEWIAAFLSNLISWMSYDFH